MNEMTKGERDTLASIIKRNHKVARTAIDQRKAELLADVEAKLAKQWQPEEFAIEKEMEQARAAVEAINDKTRRRLSG